MTRMKKSLALGLLMRDVFEKLGANTQDMMSKIKILFSLEFSLSAACRKAQFISFEACAVRMKTGSTNLHLHGFRQDGPKVVHTGVSARFTHILTHTCCTPQAPSK